MEQRKFCIVGLGLLGGSYAMALARAGCRVTGIDVRAEAVRYALENGLIADGAAAGDARVPALLGEAEVVVLGLYPGAMAPWVETHGGFLAPGALVTDVCGVKCAVVRRVQALLRPDVEFIPCHPMAGREVSGVEHADCAMFRQANFLITPTEKNTAQAIAFAEELGRTLGFAHITVLSCEEHDRMIGYVSQLAHVIAVALMNANDDPALPRTTGDSFRDLTRIAKINEHLWSELFFANRDVLVGEIDQFCAEMGRLRAALTGGDEAALKEMLRRAAERRREFDRIERAPLEEKRP